MSTRNHNIVSGSTTLDGSSFRADRGEVGCRTVYVPRVDSTNRLAREHARAGADTGTVFITDEQTAGRGRHGRSWVSAPGQNLLFSVLVRPPGPVSGWGRYAMAAGVAVVDALPEMGAGLKWPNDIVVDGRKCGGLLLEAVADAGALVLGIGLNVNQVDFPKGLAVEPVSVSLCVGRLVPREPLFHDILLRLEYWLHADVEVVRTAYRSRLVHMGAPVTIRPMDGHASISGTAVDVADDGALVVLSDGNLVTCHAGDVTMRPA